MDARVIEAEMLERCVTAARSDSFVPRDQREANIFRVAAMVIQSRLSKEAAGLEKASEAYFTAHPADRVPSESVVRNGWIMSLPRLRDMLTHELRHG